MRKFVQRDLNKIPQVRSWLKQILFQFLCVKNSQTHHKDEVRKIKKNR